MRYWRERWGDRRVHTCPSLEELCKRWGGLHLIPPGKALMQLSTNEFQVYCRRRQEYLAMALTDFRPIRLEGLL
jgi:hypothetical protein